MTDRMSFKLESFEGPLDLLLHLIAKHKLNIYDISIYELVAQYSAYMEQLRREDMEVASEFLEMAARLVHIKSSMLLPRHEEGEQLRQELAGQLLEYALIKQMAARFAQQYVGGDIFTAPPVALEVDETYRFTHRPDELTMAYANVSGRSLRRLPPPASAFSGIVQRRVVSVTSCIIAVMRKLYKRSAQRIDALFADAKDRSELVATFLAVLELVKSNRIKVDETGARVQFNRAGRRADTDSATPQ